MIGNKIYEERNDKKEEDRKKSEDISADCNRNMAKQEKLQLGNTRMSRKNDMTVDRSVNA